MLYEQPGSGVQAGSAAVAVDPNNLEFIPFDGSETDIELNLPKSSDNPGRTLFFLLTTTTNGHVVTLAPSSGDTIGGAASKVLTPAGKFCILSAKGSDWVVVAAN
jgi:hypothetical protein